MRGKHFMMATKAFHDEFGDLSLSEPGLCLVYSESEEYYIGNWTLPGLFNYSNVKFPKSTTRKLTNEEILFRYSGLGK